MKVVLQYVNQASVKVAAKKIASINKGYLLLVAFSPTDNDQSITKMVKKIHSLRTIPNSKGKIDLSIKDVGGEILIVPQFTLYADSTKGHRPSFHKSAPPQQAEVYYNQFVSLFKQTHSLVSTGIFAAHMQVESVNNGPITIILEN